MNSFVCKGCINPVTGTWCTSVDIGVNANLELVNTFCYLGNMLSVDGDADAAVETRIRIGWRGRLNSRCMWSSMLHKSETWPIRKENEVVHQRAQMRMDRWMCGIKLQDRFPSKTMRQTRFRWHNFGTTARQVEMIRACAAQRRQWLCDKMYGVKSGGCQAKW